MVLFSILSTMTTPSVMAISINPFKGLGETIKDIAQIDMGCGDQCWNDREKAVDKCGYGIYQIKKMYVCYCCKSGNTR